MRACRRCSHPSASADRWRGYGGTGRFPHLEELASRTSRALAYFSSHVLALVANALALVRLRRPHLADLGRGLADELLVDPAHHDLVRRGHLELGSLTRRDPDRVGEADLELQV